LVFGINALCDVPRDIVAPAGYITCFPGSWLFHLSRGHDLIFRRGKLIYTNKQVKTYIDALIHWAAGEFANSVWAIASSLISVYSQAMCLEASVKIQYSIHVLEKYSQPRNNCGGPQNIGHTESMLNRVGDRWIITGSHVRFG
jgi:hypothetical protein